MHIVKEYLLLFRNASAPDGYLATTKDMAEDLPKWQGWIGSIAMQGKLVSTAPMEYEGAIATTEGVLRGPYKESASVLIAGYLICRSDQPDEVQTWAATCPIHKYPNSSVEIRALIPFLIQ